MTREEADNILLKAVVVGYPTTYNGADVIQVLLEVFNDKEELEEKLKAKYDEINILKAQLAIQTAKTKVERKAKDFNDDMFWKAQKIAVQHRQKARSIVAMLFWEWKKSEREAKIERYDDWENGVSFGEDKKAEELFKEAYKMLKDNA